MSIEIKEKFLFVFLYFLSTIIKTETFFNLFYFSLFSFRKDAYITNSDCFLTFGKASSEIELSWVSICGW